MGATPKTTIRFEPLMPVRPDVIGERIFMREWHYLVGGKRATIMHSDGTPHPENFETLGVYHDQPWPDVSFYRSMARAGPLPTDASIAEAWQRRASVATSFIKWLGTSFGLHYLDDADKLYNTLQKAPIFPNYRANAYVMTWAQRNSAGDGQPRRTIVAESYTAGMYGFAVIDAFKCSYDDIRVIEEMAAWLGTDIGQRFVKTCRKKIDRIVKQERTQRYAAINAEMISQGEQPLLPAVPSKIKSRLSAPIT